MNFGDQFFYDAPICHNELVVIIDSRGRFQSGLCHGTKMIMIFQC